MSLWSKSFGKKLLSHFYGIATRGETSDEVDQLVKLGLINKASVDSSRTCLSGSVYGLYQGHPWFQGGVQVPLIIL